jgi:hypothetical protein
MWSSWRLVVERSLITAPFVPLSLWCSLRVQALTESGHPGRWGGTSERDRDTARGSISVLLRNIYLHYVLDLCFERVVKPRLKGEAYLVRYIDDFVVYSQLRSDALRFQDVLVK